MLHFNELSLTPDNKCLIVDVEVDNLDYYEDIVIDSIVIDTQDTFVLNGPSSKPLFEIDTQSKAASLYENKQHYFKNREANTKHYRLELKLKDLKVDPYDTMFFVYAIASGTSKPNTPCGYDVNKILGTVVNVQSIYKQILPYLKELSNTCNIPKGFINLILQVKALDLAIRTGNYLEAVKYWKKFFKGNNFNSINLNNNCNCHG